MYSYLNDEEAAMPNVLPSIETFYIAANDPDWTLSDGYDAGWYYWFCLPGCLPFDAEPFGPFDTEERAIHAARLEAGQEEEEGC